MAESAIELTLEGTLGAFFFAGVTEPGLLSNWDTVIDVDGERHVLHGGTHHRVAVSPGPHKVQVYFYGRKFQKAFGLLKIKVGCQTMNIDVVPGGTMRMCYRASYGWQLFGSGASLTEHA
ncbi:MAG: hypothetical protein QM765_45080 [Myxococcales bacterium]